MAINYTYPVKTIPTIDDDILIIDNADSSKATKRVKISTLPISGVTSIVAGTNVTITPSTGIGAVTINSSGGGSGTVTNVLAAPPLSSSGGITPTISMVSSDTSNNGYLLAADWNTFNQKTSNTGTVTSVTATTPLVSTGGATPSISLTAVPIALGGTGVTTGLTGYLPLAGGAMTGPITTNSTFDGVDVAARDAVLTTTTNTANAALPLAGGTMTGPITMSANINMSNTSVDGGAGGTSTISNMYSVTGNQIISTYNTLTPSSNTVTWDTGTGATLILVVAGSGTSVSTFFVNNLSVGATATIFLDSTVGNFVDPPAWRVLIGGSTQNVIWAGGVTPTIPPSAAIRKDKLTFTSNGADVYGVAHEGFL